MTRSTLPVLATTLTLLLPGGASAQIKHYPLESTDGLRLHNVAAEPAMLQGKKGLRVTVSEEAQRRFQGMPPRAFSVPRPKPAGPKGPALRDPSGEKRA